MKKIILLAIATLFFTTANAQEGRWSVGLKAGVNHYYDKAPYGLNKFPFNFAGGLDVEYSASRIVGVGLEYMYLRRSREIPFTFNDGYVPHLSARNHEVTAYVDLNLTNIFAPNRMGKFWNLYAKGGLGVSFSKYTNYYLRTAVTNSDGKDYYTYARKSDKQVVFQAGLISEWNITKSMAVFLEGQYRYYHRGNASGFNSNTHKSYKAEAWVALGGLRFKFGKNHIKNGRIPAPVVVAPAPVPVPEPAPAPKPAPKPEPKPVVKPAPKPEPKPVITVEEKKVITEAFENLQFDTNKATIKAVSYPGLDHAANMLIKYPDANAKISGYTDSTGRREYNINLSQRRADAVRDYLIGKGVSASRLTAIGFGPDNPVDTNATAAGRAKNRRVEIDVQQ